MLVAKVSIYKPHKQTRSTLLSDGHLLSNLKEF